MNRAHKTIAVALIGSALALTACTSPSSEAAETPDADCVPEWTFPTAQEGTLTMASVVAMPFIDVQPGSNEGGGIEGALLDEFAARSCLTTDYQVLDGTGAIAALTEDRADIANGGWFWTEARGETLGQTDPYLYEYSAIISQSGFASVEDLEGKVVGVQTGSLYIEPLGAAIGAENVRQYASVDAIAQDIQAGRLDAGLSTESKTKYQLEANGRDDLQVLVLDPDPAHPVITNPGLSNWPHPIANTELGDALNAFIADIRASGLLEETLAEFGITSDANLNGPDTP